MTKSAPMMTLGWGVFGLFVVLGGLALLAGANHAAPGCTGPAVARCDYVATARDAVARSDFPPFSPDRAYEIFDEGSSVRVQQAALPKAVVDHGPSVLIDRTSCRVCEVDGRRSTRGDARDAGVGALIARAAASGG